MTTVTDTWATHPDQFWLRGQAPPTVVEYAEKLGFWKVYGYPEAVRILADPRTFSSDTSRFVPRQDFVEGNLPTMDPPEHHKLRKLVSRAFTPKVVADLEPRLAELTNDLLDQVGADGTDGGRTDGRMELVADLAYPLPVTVIAELLGVPSSDRHLFKQWVDGAFNSSEQFSLVEPSERQRRAMDQAFEQLHHLTDYLGEHAAERRRHPREDLLTKLVEAEVDGERLSDTAVVNFANVLLIAGHITTTMLLGNTVLCLDAHPDAAARVRADRSLVPAAIEESLRFLSPFAALARVPTTDVELGGSPIPAGQMVMVVLAAANRDPRQFTDPNVFDPARDPNPHLAFGRGIHFCIGAPLARLEGRVALNILLDRLPHLRTDPDEPPTFLPSPNLTGVRTLPLLLDPR
ncbi:cytochrome P450 [Actinopolymorpha sp. NPDC004070]|uniref:cytochrome P450 n=1 Tax=Actinopolymorpha sp. NPDC004070 TaxID=3154548 RepID=UPI0033AD8502